MATETITASRCRRVRWRRSAWHRLLVAIDTRGRTSPVTTALVLGVDQAQLDAWLDADELMSIRMQWRLVHIAEARYGEDAPLVRAAQALRAQLEATAAFLSRGPVKTNLTPEAVRAMQP